MSGKGSDSGGSSGSVWLIFLLLATLGLGALWISGGEGDAEALVASYEAWKNVQPTPQLTFKAPAAMSRSSVKFSALSDGNKISVYCGGSIIAEGWDSVEMEAELPEGRNLLSAIASTTYAVPRRFQSFAGQTYNVSTRSEAEVVIDTTPPQLRSSKFGYNSTSLYFGGSVADELTDVKWVEVNGWKMITGEPEDFVAEIPFEEIHGETLLVVAKDALGNEMKVNIPIKLPPTRWEKRSPTGQLQAISMQAPEAGFLGHGLSRWYQYENGQFQGGRYTPAGWYIFLISLVVAAPAGGVAAYRSRLGDPIRFLMNQAFYRVCLAEAEAHLRAGRFVEAEEAITQVPDSLAGQMRARIQDVRLADAYERAQAALYGGDIPQATAILDQVLPKDYPGANELRLEVIQRQHDRKIAQGMAAVKSGDLGAAEGILKELEASFADLQPLFAQLGQNFQCADEAFPGLAEFRSLFTEARLKAKIDAALKKMWEVDGTYYGVLFGERVDAKAMTPDDIRDAFRKRAPLFHPDLHPGDKVAEEQTKLLNEANQILSDPDSRTKYDQELSLKQDLIDWADSFDKGGV